ncbi:MAG: peptidoglycan DD-metalloendopeptidase family protein [Alphaproteobacteria bacterium]|nr:peptidoglycan DD-metalloendopeptidase family protein [Alphaproteobacteria bacterium]
MASQSMPAPLASQPTGMGRYVPPADVGRPIAIAPVTTAAVSQAPVAANGTAAVRSQPLPPVITSGGSPAMSAQQTVQVSSAPVPGTLGTQPLPQALAQPGKTASPVGGPIHTIASGESLYVIARRYGVEPDTIVKANGLSSMDKIYVGQKLVIPGGKLASQPAATPGAGPAAAPKTPTSPVRTEVASTTDTTVTASASETVNAMVKPPAEDGKFRWPLSGTVITDFAASRSGINIAAQEGTAVRAAETGMVIYTGSAVQGYGNLVLIKHENGYVSAYAHLKDITVAKGETVGRGDAIGSTGMTGGVSRPQLHFELRKGATPVDPMPLLAG